jgi:hypothetical protein
MDEQKKLSDWVALGTLDLEEFMDAHLEDVQDWELNFRILKVGSGTSYLFSCKFALARVISGL